MAATQVPLGDISPDPRSALYIAALEKKLTILTLNEIKYRTLLEMLTGEEWEEISTDIGTGDLRKVAVNATQRRLIRELKKAERQADSSVKARAEEIVSANVVSANEFAKDEESV